MSQQHPESQTTPDQQAPAHQDDEEVHVPRGQSRTRFMIILGLLVFSLIIYVVPAQFQSLFKPSDPSEGAYMVWNHPTLGRQEMSNRDFTFARRRFDNFLRLVNSGKEGRLFLDKDEQIGRVLVLDRIALDAGIEVTDNELRKLIRDGGYIVLAKSKDLPAGMMGDFFFQVPAFADSATYAQALQSAGTSDKEFREALRTMLRVQRYEAMLSVVSQPDGATIEKAWKERHKQHSFDVVAFNIETAKTAAATEMPDELGLIAWYEQMDPARKRSMFQEQWTPERASAELVVWRSGDAVPGALLAKYPRAAGTDLEKLAHDYYDRFAHLRFRRATEKTDAANDFDKVYQSFDEVAEQARAESQGHAAIVDMQADMQARLQKGEAVDWAGETAALGLTLETVAAPLTQQEWTDDPKLGDSNLSDQLMRAARGDKFIALVVGTKQLVFGHVLEHSVAGAPPFTVVREACVDAWLADKATELATAQAKAFVESLKSAEAVPGAAPTAESAVFAEKAQAVNASVVATGWIDAGKLPEDFAANADDAQRFAVELSAGARVALTSAENAVLGPLPSGDRSRLFVVRHVGVREPEKVAIEPKDYGEIERQATYERYRETREGLVSPAALSAKYGVEFPSRKDKDAPPAPKS